MYTSVPLPDAPEGAETSVPKMCVTVPVPLSIVPLEK